jgi:citrate lyase alpha subunit
MSVAMSSEKAMEAIRNGSVVVRVKRSGMLQTLTLKIRKVSLGDGYFIELHFGRILDIAELHRIANEIGLPVEAENGTAFPEGKGAKDFMGL